MKVNDIIQNESFKTLISQMHTFWNSDFNFNLVIKERGRNRPPSIYEIDSIKAARNRYLWPYSVQCSIENPGFENTGQTFEDSMSVLSYAKDLIISNNKLKEESSIKEGTKLILQWGGVYKAGNKKKCNDTNYSLLKDYTEVINKWNDILNNEDFSENDSFHFQSNAGFTKVYSLILKDFIIYDSRVSVAMAYIIDRIFKSKIPDFLQLYIPPSYIASENQDRRVVNNIFRSTNSNKGRHFFSNVIANLILKAVLTKVQENDGNATLRDIESALFMIGYDIRNQKVK